MDAMGFVEEFLDCAGMCELAKFYTFSDVRLGEPYIDCADAMAEYAESNFVVYSLAAFFLCITLLGGMIGSCMVCKYSNLRD